MTHTNIPAVSDDVKALVEQLHCEANQDGTGTDAYNVMMETADMLLSLAARAEAAEARVAELERERGEPLRSIPLYTHPESDWQPIETAPKCQKVNDEWLRVWVWGGRYSKPELKEADGDWWRQQKREHSVMAPTHWCVFTLPVAPTPSTASGGE